MPAAAPVVGGRSPPVGASGLLTLTTAPSDVAAVAVGKVGEGEGQQLINNPAVGKKAGGLLR